MTALPKRTLISAAIATALLLALNLWLWPNQSLQQSATSFGINRNGFKAAFDLLSEMDLPVARSYRRINSAPPDHTVWFIAPSFIDPGNPNADNDAHDVVKWASRGGTAVVFGEDGANWAPLGLTRDVEKNNDSDKTRFLVHSDIGTPGRWLDVPELVHFAAAKEKEPNPPRVLLSVDGKPFALELKEGKSGGRIIAVADDVFLRNEHLGDADACLLVADLARSFGAPTFDEHAHGLSAPSSLALAILESRAIVPIALGFLVAMLWVVARREWPRRSLDDDAGPPAPSIEGFVDSLSVLYGRAGDPAAVFHAYRTGFMRRLRHQLGLRADFPEDLLLARLANDRAMTEDTRHWLLEGAVPSDERHLVNAVRAIESYPESYAMMGNENRTR